MKHTVTSWDMKEQGSQRTLFTTRKGLNDSNRDGQRQKIVSSWVWLRAREVRHHSEVFIAPERMQWGLRWERRHGPPADTQTHNANTQCWCLSGVKASALGTPVPDLNRQGRTSYLQGSRHETHSMEPLFNYFHKLLMLFMALCTSNFPSLLIYSL